ncbi:MAG: hypothetical protein D3923_07855 [Candidatus Electrothrix sp. AR3]|nr:hypothetical protein [Candidatus Electrothrix sp. AR3]
MREATSGAPVLGSKGVAGIKKELAHGYILQCRNILSGGIIAIFLRRAGSCFLSRRITLGRRCTCAVMGFSEEHIEKETRGLKNNNHPVFFIFLTVTD